MAALLHMMAHRPALSHPTQTLSGKFQPLLSNHANILLVKGFTVATKSAMSARAIASVVPRFVKRTAHQHTNMRENTHAVRP